MKIDINFVENTFMFLAIVERLYFCIFDAFT